MSMAGPDGSDPEGGTASGSDPGDLGGHLGPGDLAPDEERLLAALERDARGLREPSVEETLLPVRAVGDDGRSPGSGGPPDDGLTPLFTAPELGD